MLTTFGVAIFEWSTLIRRTAEIVNKYAPHVEIQLDAETSSLFMLNESYTTTYSFKGENKSKPSYRESDHDAPSSSFRDEAMPTFHLPRWNEQNSHGHDHHGRHGNVSSYPSSSFHDHDRHVLRDYAHDPLLLRANENAHARFR